MRHYVLHIHVRLVETEEVPEPIEVRPGSDPVTAFSNIANRVLTVPRMAQPFMEPPQLTMQKQVPITVQNFADLTQILAQFETLTSEIEVQKLA
jgi:hypothetical protein